MKYSLLLVLSLIFLISSCKKEDEKIAEFVFPDRVPMHNVMWNGHTDSVIVRFENSVISLDTWFSHDTIDYKSVLLGPSTIFGIIIKPKDSIGNLFHNISLDSGLTWQAPKGTYLLEENNLFLYDHSNKN